MMSLTGKGKAGDGEQDRFLAWTHGMIGILDQSAACWGVQVNHGPNHTTETPPLPTNLPPCLLCSYPARGFNSSPTTVCFSIDWQSLAFRSDLMTSCFFQKFRRSDHSLLFNLRTLPCARSFDFPMDILNEEGSRKISAPSVIGIVEISRGARRRRPVSRISQSRPRTCCVGGRAGPSTSVVSALRVHPTDAACC